MIQIYALLDPVTEEVRYVGQSKDAVERLRGHLGRARDGVNTHLYCWLRKIGKPGLRILEEVQTRPLADERERHWIAWFRAQGMNLTNIAPGGTGGYEHSEHTKQKISAAKKGIPLLPLRGVPLSIEHRQKLADRKRGAPGNHRVPHSVESRQKNAAAHKGRPSPFRGRRHTEEANRKNSEAHSGKPWSAARRQAHEARLTAARS